MRRLLVFLITVPALAGCVTDQPQVEPGGDRDLGLVEIPAFPIEVDHDHADAALHTGGANLHTMAYHSGYGDGTTEALPAGQGFSELFVRDGLAFLGRRGGPDGGFVIFDVNDPSMPRGLGAFQGLANYDMESTHDNRYVFYVSQYLNNQQPASVPPRGPGDVPRQIHLVDIADPMYPEWVGALPVPSRGVHTLTYHRTEAGRELVIAQTYDFIPDPSLGTPVPDQGTSPAAQRVLILEFVRTPEPHLALLSTFEKHPASLEEGREAFPHDTFVQKHPLTGQLILYVAYWDLGAFLVDITDPTKPSEISHLTDFSPSKIAQVHLAAPSDQLIQGRHITVTEPELGGAESETGQYTLFDTTDPAAPIRLGYWELPGVDANDEGTRFSPHNFDVEGGRIYLAHYHAGVWVIDISTNETLAAPKALAYTQPSEAREDAPGDSSNVWTVLYDGGCVFASDIATGLYVFHYAGDPMPMEMTATLAPRRPAPDARSHI